MPNLPYISPKLLEEYQEDVASQVSSATTKRRMAALKRFFGWAHKEGHIPENPIPQVPVPSIEPGTQIIPVQKSRFKPLNILKLGVPVVLIVLIFLLARRVKLPIPFLPAPASEPEELTGFTPSSPTPRPVAGPTPQATASGEIDPIFSKIYKDGVLTLEGLSPALKAIGGLLIEGEKIIIKTSDTSDGDIEINPDGSGIAHFLFEGTGQNFLNAQAPNLTSGSLYYGIVANNAVGYDLLRLQSGSKPITRFSVDARGNTEVGGNLDLAGNLSTLDTIRLTSAGALTNITGYSQISGNFTISQAAGDTATITKKASALNDVLTLTLDERGVPSSGYSTLTLKRYDGATEAMALFVDEGNARFDGQLQLGRFSSNPTSIGQGSLVFNTADTTLYVWNGTSWIALGGGSASGFWQRNLGALSPSNITDDVLVGGTATASALVRLPGLNNQDAWFNLGTGNVGVGITTPTYKLDVSSTGSVARFGSTTTNAIELRTNDTATGFWVRNDGANVVLSTKVGDLFYGFSGRDGLSQNFYSGSGPTNTLILTSARAGVGTSGPDAKLDVLATTEQLRLTYTDGSVFTSFTVSSAGNLTIDTTGGTVDINDTTLDLSTQGTDIEIIDNVSTSLTISEGANNYITIDTTDTLENLILSAGSSTTTRFVRIGATSASTTPDLLVVDKKSDAGNPTGVTGALFINSTDKFMINEAGTWKEVCNKTDQTCGTGSGGTTTAWSSLTDPSTNLTLNMVANTTTMNWDFAVDGTFWDMNFDNNGGTAGTDYAVEIANTVSTNATGDLNTEALLRLDNADTTASGGSTIVDNAILVTNTGGITSGVVDALDASATEIDNALNAGQNFILLSALRLFEPSAGTLTVEDTSNFDMIQITDQGDTGKLAVSNSLQVGGLTTAAYSRFGTASTGHGLAAADDVIVMDLEVDGALFVDSGTIASSFGPGTTQILMSSDPVNNNNALSVSSWLIQNDNNVGMAALMINQTKSPDIIAASASGVTKFRVTNVGDVFLGNNSGTDLTVGCVVDACSGTGKIDVGTVDPPYMINGTKYATYLSAMVGVKEEVTGNVQTSIEVPGLGYKHIIDFNQLDPGSDLWLFSKATELWKNIDHLVALLTPGVQTKTWYELDKQNFRLSIYTSIPTTVSYRLTAPRFDWYDWSNLRDSEAIGFILNDEEIHLNLGENDPQFTINDVSLIEASSEGQGLFELRNSLGQIIHETSVVSKSIMANITAGALEAKYIATDSLVAFQASVDNLIISSGLVSPIIETETISPLPDKSNITVKIGQENVDSGFGKLIVANTQGEEVASIDTQGNASFSGTLEANEVKTNEITAGKIYADEIIAGKGAGMTREEIEKMLREVEEDQTILTQVSTWSIDTASGSANLEELVLASLYVTETAALNTLSVTSSITLGSDLVIQSRQSENLTVNSIDTLSAPLSIQSLALAPVEIMAGKVRIDTDGSVTIAGNLNVAGQIESGALKTKELTTDKLIIAANKPTTESPQLTSGEITTNATAGVATIPTGTREITINNPNISDYTLVYVTPTSSTLNNTLYVKSKGAGFFMVGFSDPLDLDVNFNWWIIDIKE